MKKGLVASSMQYKSITLLLSIVLMLSGMVSLIFIPKNEFPHFELPIGMVVGVYPGASEEEVELQLANPMEDFLWSFKEIDKVKTMTVSENGLCYSIVFLNQSVKNKAEFWNKLKERIPLLRAQLPTGVLGVVANEDFGDVTAMLVTIESDTKTYRELEDYEKQLCDRLRTIPSLANIYKMGMQKEQIGVYIDRDRLPSYGLNTFQLYQKLSSQSGTMYMGSLDDGQLSRGFHIRSTVNSEHDLANLIIHSNPAGGVVRLGDVADIKREYPAPKRFIKNNGKKCLLLSLQMTEGHNIVDFSNKVKDEIAECMNTLPKDVAINVITDQGEVVSKSVDDFLIEMLIAIVSVILVVMFILPVRVAGVAVVTIPITIFASLTMFYFCGIEINSVSLAALIVSLGMIVDDSVVVVDCYLDKLDEGMSRWQAAIQSARQFTSSIFTATLCISITFFPLLFTTDNIIHDFIMWFPFSISIVLVISMLVALLVVPILQFQFVRKGLKGNSAGFLDKMQAFYDRMLEGCFRHRYTTLAVGLACIVVGGLLLLLIPQRLMPRATRDQFAVEVILPTGTDIRHTEHVADSMANILMRDERVTNLTVFYGSGSPRFHAMFIPQYGGTHYAQFIVNTHSDSETQAILKDYTAKYSNYFPEAQVLFREIVYSDAQYPIDVRLVGDNIDSLRVAAGIVESKLRKNPQLLTVNTSMGTVNSNIEIDLNASEASRINMSRSMLAINLALRYSGGIPAASMWEGDNEIPVVIKDINAGKQSVDELKNIRVTSFVPGITTEPLSQMATVKPDWSGGSICHRNGIRTANIYATVTRDAVIGNLTKEVYGDMAKLKLPEGVKIEKGGQAQTEETYRPQLYLGVVIAVIITFFILLFHLKSISLTILLMATLLFSLLGTSLGLLVFGSEFGATAMLGIISLMGIIARCGIIMVDYSEELQQKEGLSAMEAAKTAARRRFRPIFLTSSAASMGVVPMVIENTPLWGPMGAVICVGSLVSMMFIITMIPVAYSFIMKNVKPFKVPAMLILALLLPMPVDAQRTVTLDECLSMARKNNYKIRNADNEILMAKEQQKWARTKYFPLFSANLSHYEANDYLMKMDLLSDEWQDLVQEIIDAMGDASNPTNIAIFKRASSASIGMLEPLYTGGRISSVNKLTDLQIEARQLMRSMADDEVVQQTEFLYYGIMMMHGKINTLEALQKETESILKDARNLSDAGIVNQNDVLSVELTLDQMAALHLKLDNTTRLMRRALAKSMGIPNDDIDVDTTVVADVVAPETMWMDVQSAVNNRNESRLLDINVERAKLETRLARANLLPIVAVGGNFGATHVFSSTNVRAIGFITMSIPISTFWSENHLLKRKKIAENVAVDFRNDKRELIDLQVRDAYDNLVSAYQQIEIAEKSIVRADENLRICREKYVNGVSTMTTLLDAQRQQLQAHDQYNDALTEYLRSKSSYLIITGRHDK